jgi:hypothetical protein
MQRSVTQNETEQTIWLMDSDFCDKCNVLLGYGETGLCMDCADEEMLQDEEEWEEWTIDEWQQHEWGPND